MLSPRRTVPSHSVPMAAQPRQLDPRIWRACTGSSVQIPTLHSIVYYFPQGHFEQTSCPPQILSPLLFSSPIILCRIIGVQFLADPITDEVFAKVRLQPINRQTAVLTHPTRTNETEFDHGGDDEDDDKIVSFAKILTPSDANNGGGFSVPRFCADSIFPPLNFAADPPVQTLSITDIHGGVWDFRHIYRGTPRRHLLTTGWSKFVNHKKLVAGDSVVFMKNSRGKMFVGVRRAVRSSWKGDCGRYSSLISGMRSKQDEDGCGGGGSRFSFSRSAKGKLSAEAVAEAAELAAQDKPFEVVYYPRAPWSEFLVKAEIVEKACNVFWSESLRVKIAMETEDSSRITWLQGTVSSISTPAQNEPWQFSPWRMLEVSWDDPEVLQNVKRVSPWEVEIITENAPFPPAKRFRTLGNSSMLSDGERTSFFPVTGLSNPTVSLNRSLLTSYKFPAGMQGARQNIFCASILPNSYVENSLQMYTDNSFKTNIVPKLKTVSTDLNIGSSNSISSPDGQGSPLSTCTELVGNQFCNSKKVGYNSIQLFGKVIHMEQPVESGFNDGGGYREDDGNMGFNELPRQSTRSFLDLLC